MRMKRWKKKPRTGSHYLRIDGVMTRVRPGETVDCTELALGSNIKNYDVVIDLPESTVEPIPEETIEPPGTEPEDAPAGTPPYVGLEMYDIGGGFWDILNPDNPEKPLNDEPLTLEEAQAFLADAKDPK